MGEEMETVNMTTVSRFSLKRRRKMGDSLEKDMTIRGNFLASVLSKLEILEYFKC